MSVSRPRVGVLGAGQLALMLAEAAAKLDVEIVCAGQPGDCAERVAKVVPVDLASADEVAGFAAQVDFVTLESENIDAEVVAGLRLFPNANAVAIAQDRLLEKNFLQSCGIRVAPFAAVDRADDFAAAFAVTGLPAILKTRRMGYDGKGQVRLRDAEQAPQAFASLNSAPCIVEGMVAFEAEVSLIAARSTSGEIVFYPLTQNVHRDGILRRSVSPSYYTHLQAQAEAMMTGLMQRLEYVGVLAVEFFVQGEELIANEMAPRVHNSGHWTIEGSAASQFENHLRAIVGVSLGSTASRAMTMLNCIGTMPPESETVLYPALYRHDYGKAAQPGRKVGHLTCASEEVSVIAEWEQRLRD